jgi:multiple sugar transport system permease protein
MNKTDQERMPKPRFTAAHGGVGAKRYEPYLWLSPALVVLVGMVLYPWLWTFYISLTRWNPLMQATPIFNGFGNYLRILTDPNFLTSIKLTFILTVGTVSLQFIIGFGLALMLNTDIKGKAVFRTLLLIPMMLTPSVVGMLWKIILQDEFGVANWVLSLVGIAKVGWLSTPELTMPLIIGIQTWIHMPFVMLMMYAGLQSVPGELLEAAKVDGANFAQQLWSVIIPWLKPIIVLVMLFRIMFALRTFDTIFGIWQSSGPLKSGMVLGAYLYEQVRMLWQFGAGAAVSYLMLFITLAFTAWPMLKMYRGGEK